MLFVSQNVQVENHKVHTASSSYRLSTAERKDAWLIRWEYTRSRPREDYPYPLAHVHVNAQLIDQEAEGILGKPLPHLHIPTARVPLELVLWHLIAEWGVSSRSHDWQNQLEESLAGFYERQTAS